jgi:hypothetical protein
MQFQQTIQPMIVFVDARQYSLRFDLAPPGFMPLLAPRGRVVP